MKPGIGGITISPPKLGRAIIGATLLLKGDAQVPWRDHPQGDAEPDLAQSASKPGLLPETQFGRADVVKVVSNVRSAALASTAIPAALAMKLANIEHERALPLNIGDAAISPDDQAADVIAEPSLSHLIVEPVRASPVVAVAARPVVDLSPFDLPPEAPEAPAALAQPIDSKIGAAAPADLFPLATAELANPAAGIVPPDTIQENPSQLVVNLLADQPQEQGATRSIPSRRQLPQAAGGDTIPSAEPQIVSGVQFDPVSAPPVVKLAIATSRLPPAITPAEPALVLPQVEQFSPASPAISALVEPQTTLPAEAQAAEPLRLTAPPLPVPEFGPAAPEAILLEQAPQPLQATQAFAGMPTPRNAIASPAVKSEPKPVPDRSGYLGSPSSGNDYAASAITYDDELILQIQSQRGEIVDTISGYGLRAGTYLPLGAIARFLDLAITVSDEGHYASGWFIDEKQTLSINLRQGTLLLNGKEVPLAKGDAVAFDGELFLKADTFSQLLPLTLAVDLRSQMVTVKTRVPFPFEQRIAREQQRERLAGGGGQNQKKNRWPRQPTPYQALTFPLMDADLRAVSDSTFGPRVEGDLRLAGDLAFMTARAFVSGTSRDGLTGARIEMGRRDPDAKLLGPLGASEYRIGDVSTISMPIGLRGVSGRGGFVTNAPLERASVFDTVDLRGDLPEGFEVELYRNNILIGSTRDATDGEYRFLKVGVEYGINVFRLVFFGPQGQRREEVRQFSVGDGRLGKGEFVYSLGAAQKDVNLFNVYPPNFTPTIDRGAWRSSALLQYGLSEKITGLLGGSYFDGQFGRQWQVNTGLRTGISGTAIKLDLGYQSGGGKAIELGLGGKLLGIGYTATHAEYQGKFTDEVRSLGGESLRRASELNFNTSVNLGGKDSPLPIPLYGQVRRIDYVDGRKQMNATLQGSLAISRYLASASLNFSNSSTPGFGSNSQMLGSFDLSRMSGTRLRLRGSVDYAILPKLKLTGGQLEADYTVDDRTSLRASVGHVLDDKRTYFGLSAIRRFGNFTLAFDGSYGVPRKDYRAALRLGFSFGRNPLNGDMFFAEPGMASGGAIAARAFRDSNANLRFDAGEELLPGVDFSTSSRHGTTNKNGVAVIGGLGDGSRTSLVIDRATLPDLALAPVSDGVEVIARAGRVHVSDYALQELSDIVGTAYFNDAGRSGQAVSGLRLEIADSTGKVLAKTRTESDGTYFFEQIPPGRYAIQIDKNQAISLRISLAQDIALSVSPKSSSLQQVIKIVRDTAPMPVPSQ